jgi:hypothetical protein
MPTINAESYKKLFDPWLKRVTRRGVRMRVTSEMLTLVRDGLVEGPAGVNYKTALKAINVMIGNVRAAEEAAKAEEEAKAKADAERQAMWRQAAERQELEEDAKEKAGCPSYNRRRQILRVLGLKMHATKAEIKAAYRAKAKQHHPDHGGDPDAFRRIKDAYERALKFSYY